MYRGSVDAAQMDIVADADHGAALLRAWTGAVPGDRRNLALALQHAGQALHAILGADHLSDGFAASLG